MDYTVVVDAGNEYEKAREPVSIYRDAAPGGRSFQLAIQLYPKVNSSNPLFANVPDKYLGGLYMSVHKNQAAADELEKYLKLDPKAADADRIKGTIKDLRSKQ